MRCINHAFSNYRHLDFKPKASRSAYKNILSSRKILNEKTNK